MKSNLQSSPLQFSRYKQKQKLPGLSKRLYKDYHNGSLKKISHHKQYNSLFPKLIFKNKQFSFQMNMPKRSQNALQKSFNDSINHNTKCPIATNSNHILNYNTNNDNLNYSNLSKQNKKKYPQNIKKRQKLHTQGISENNISDKDNIDQSFISLTNHVINQQQQVLHLQQQDNTMINFRKKIQQNKIIIKQQIQKKNKQNQSISKRQSSFIKKKRISSQKIIQYSPQNQDGISSKQIVQTQKRTIDSGSNSIKPTLNSNRVYGNNSRKNQKCIIKQKNQIFQEINVKSRKNNKKQRQRRQKTEISTNNYNQVLIEKSIISEKKFQSPTNNNQGLFSNLQVILEDKMKPQSDKAKNQQKKFKNLLQKLNRLKTDNNYSSFQHHQVPITQSQQLLSCSFKKLKRQTNYNDWNKLDFSSTSEVTYRKSSFEDQLRKISEYTDRNEASLEKYLHTRKQLLKYGFQVSSGENTKKNK